MPTNQCDGCRRGLPIIDGVHRGASLYDSIACTADRYKAEPDRSLCLWKCPVCGGETVMRKAKLVCNECHVILETCCD